MNESGRKKWLIAGAAVCVSVFFADRFLITPLWEKWTERSSRIAELSESVENGEALLERRASLEDRWQTMVESDFPENTSEAEGLLLNSVSNWAVGGGLEVAALKPQWSEEDENAATLECRASVLGSMWQVSDFLYQLEAGELALRTEEVVLTANDEQGGRLQGSLRFSGVILKEVKE